MLLTPWLRSIKSSVFTNSRRSAHHRLASCVEKRTRLMAAEVERLEDRTLLSIAAFFDSTRQELMIDMESNEDVLSRRRERLHWSKY